MKTDLKYLKHLAKKGESYIHPKGRDATGLLINKLSVKEGDKILELGCGTGATLVAIASVYNVELHGIDVLDEMLQAARKRIESTKTKGSIRLRKIDPGIEFPFPDEKFDKVYAESVLGFQDEETMKFMLSEARRVLRKGGIFAVNEALWKENIPDKTVERIVSNSVKDFGLAHASPSNIDLHKFCSLASECGFKLAEIVELSNLQSAGVSDYLNNSNVRNDYSLFEFIYKLKLRKHRNNNKYIIPFLMVFTPHN